jgi:hypothetical protein
VVAERPIERLEGAFASPTSGTVLCLPASNAATLSWTSRALPGSCAREPVVKSCRRVPMARTRSASAASVLAADEPVTPIEPKFCG